MSQFNAGKYQVYQKGTEAEFQAFSPTPLFQNYDFKDKSTLLLLEEANRLLGEMNAYSRLIPDVDYFIKMHVNREAVTSSRIEGTRTEIDEALLPKEEIDPERRDDWQEVQNYITAMNFATEELKKLPVSVRLLKNAHKILLTSVRGEHKLPGEIRDSQNWIGGSSIRTAHFVPPHKNDIPELLSDWEKFWHDSSLHIPVLIKIALLHYQFETIHPFLDGNGRVGRMFITLQLIERGFLDKPVLYLSDYFEQFRQSYYDSLDRVRTKNDWEGWVRFFLEGVIQTSKKGKKKFEDIITLRTHYDMKLISLGRRIPNSKRLLLAMFSQPFMSVADVQKVLSVTYKSANNLVADLVGVGILSEKTGYSRNRLFELKDYVTIFRK